VSAGALCNILLASLFHMFNRPTRPNVEPMFWFIKWHGNYCKNNGWHEKKKEKWSFQSWQLTNFHASSTHFMMYL
jgi:hypothetical protein